MTRLFKGARCSDIATLRPKSGRSRDISLLENTLEEGGAVDAFGLRAGHDVDVRVNVLAGIRGSTNFGASDLPSVFLSTVENKRPGAKHYREVDRGHTFASSSE